MPMFYVIGDVHGEAQAYRTLIERVNERAADDPEAVLVQVGDLIDRGPDSRKVVELTGRLESIAPNVNRAIVLRGNHENDLEAMLRGEYADPQHWYSLDHGRAGGRATLRSYGIELGETPSDTEIVEALRAAIPETHRELLYSLPYMHQGGDYIFVHAGIDPDRPLYEQDGQDLLYIRERFLDQERKLDRPVVHGHTPEPDEHVGPGRINVDTGAGYGRELSCFVLPKTYEPEAVEVFSVQTRQDNRWLDDPGEYEEKTGHITPPESQPIPEPISLR